MFMHAVHAVRFQMKVSISHRAVPAQRISQIGHGQTRRQHAASAHAGRAVQVMATPQPQVRQQEVADRYTEVVATWGFSWLCLLGDAKRLSRALAVKAAGKHQEYAEQVRTIPFPRPRR